MKYYAVLKGRIPGIYTNWGDCQSQISGFSGAKFHSFKSLEEANEYLQQSEVELPKFKVGDTITYPCAFIDGSYNPKEKVYGYGGYIEWLNEENKIESLTLKGNGKFPNLLIMRNISGEILGAIKAIETAIELKLSEINIYFDYLGVALWANKEWNTENSFIKDYIDFVEKSKGLININFIKVDAHTGVPENEKADKLAKESVGLI